MIVNTELARSTGHLQKDLWETPDHIFNELNKEFGFTLDPCCEIETAKCKRFFTPQDDGLEQSWADERVFINPPYSRGNIDRWMAKCFVESYRAELIVSLIPVSTSSAWFHKFVLGSAELRFLKGRIRFKGAPFTAPFSSMLAIYR